MIYFIGMRKVNDIDREKFAVLCQEITDNFRLIKDLFPEGNNNILKHLAASAIHMAFFTANVRDILCESKTNIDKDLINDFLKTCGCKEYIG